MSILGKSGDVSNQIYSDGPTACVFLMGISPGIVDAGEAQVLRKDGHDSIYPPSLEISVAGSRMLGFYRQGGATLSTLWRRLLACRIVRGVRISSPGTLL